MDCKNLIEIILDARWKSKFERVPVSIYWYDIFDEYPDLPKLFIWILLVATTHLQQLNFSKWVCIESDTSDRVLY